MFKSILLSLIFSLLACDLISEKGSHALLLKLEQELINYNTKIKQEKSTYNKKKQALAHKSTNNNQTPILSQGTTKHLDTQINESDKLKEKCKEIIQITSAKIQEMEALHNKALEMKENANKINKEFENSRTSSSSWSPNKKSKVIN